MEKPITRGDRADLARRGAICDRRGEVGNPNMRLSSAALEKSGRVEVGDTGEGGAGSSSSSAGSCFRGVGF
jgi:hypothetical protein